MLAQKSWQYRWLSEIFIFLIISENRKRFNIKGGEYLKYEKYAKLRDERGLTDYQVAKKTGISSATLSEWKSGIYTPKIDKMIKIADLFGLSLDSLFREDPNESES